MPYVLARVKAKAHLHAQDKKKKSDAKDGRPVVKTTWGTSWVHDALAADALLWVDFEQQDSTGSWRHAFFHQDVSRQGWIRLTKVERVDVAAQTALFDRWKRDAKRVKVKTTDGRELYAYGFGIVDAKTGVFYHGGVLSGAERHATAPKLDKEELKALEEKWVAFQRLEEKSEEEEKSENPYRLPPGELAAKKRKWKSLDAIAWDEDDAKEPEEKLPPATARAQQNIALAKAAIATLREAYDETTAKSSNKLYAFEAYSAHVNARVDLARAGDPTTAADLMRSRRGRANCGELANWAFRLICERLIAERRYIPVHVGQFPEGSDHAYVIIDSRLGTIDRFDLFISLGPDAVICDPWANIVSTAAEFPSAWRRKMRKWAVAGKLLDDATGASSPLKWSELALLPDMEVFKRWLGRTLADVETQHPRTKVWSKPTT